MTIEVKGRDLVAGVPKTLTINSDEIRDALAEPVNAIVEAVRVVLEPTPPELSADIVHIEIVLPGGGPPPKNPPALVPAGAGRPSLAPAHPTSPVRPGVTPSCSSPPTPIASPSSPGCSGWPLAVEAFRAPDISDA